MRLCRAARILKISKTRWNQTSHSTFVGYPTMRERTIMSVEHFQRFAAECEAMADGTRNPLEKELWMGLAERWLRCAALMEREESEVRARRKKQRETIH